MKVFEVDLRFKHNQHLFEDKTLKINAVEVLKHETRFHYNARALKFFSMAVLKLVEFRKATPIDLKIDRKNMRIGQTYAVSQDNGQTVDGIFSIKGDEDPFILKHYLENDMLLVPVNDPSFSEWIENKLEQESVDSDQ